MRLPVLVLAEDHKNGFARIGEHAFLHEIEQPFGKIGWQIDFKTEATFARLFAQGPGLCDIGLPFRRGPPVLFRQPVLGLVEPSFLDGCIFANGSLYRWPTGGMGRLSCRRWRAGFSAPKILKRFVNEVTKLFFAGAGGSAPPTEQWTRASATGAQQGRRCASSALRPKPLSASPGAAPTKPPIFRPASVLAQALSWADLFPIKALTPF